MSKIEIVWPGESIQLSPESSGFAHGFGLFETMRLRSGRLEFWVAHWERLMHSAQELRLACELDSDQVLDAIRTLAKELPDEAVIKLSLMKEADTSKLFVYSRPMLPCPERFGLFLEYDGIFNEHSPLSGHKTHNYLENLLVLEAARNAGCYDALRVNSKGDAVEGAISNLFLLRGNSWHTPSLKSAPLPGIIRRALLGAMQVKQGAYTLHDVVNADGVYLSNSSIGLQPVDWLCYHGNKLNLKSRQNSHYEKALAALNAQIEDYAILL